MFAAEVANPSGEYLVVDLDGTVVLTDTFAACVLEALRKRFSSLPAVIGGLMRGRAFSKHIAASLAKLNVESLPYNEPLLDYLREQKAAGRKLVLATGADLIIATQVAEYLGIFDEVIASNGTSNLTGEAKLRAIQQRIGGAPFAYAGNSRADLRVWRRSQAAILVGAPRSCANKLRAAGVVVLREFGHQRSWWQWVRCLRPHQWSKNVLVFVPVLLSHQIGNLSVLLHALLAFLALSFAASAMYIINDLLDLQADRLHPVKRRRPLASGTVTVETGFGLGALVAMAAAALAFGLPPQGRVLLALYTAASLSYSLKLKRMLFLDVVSLSLLYALRVLYGGTTTGIDISVWTLAFSLFLFTSLASVKRLAELRRFNSGTAGIHEYRGYMAADVNQLSSLASAAGCVAVLVLALYINSPEVRLLYNRPQGLWLLCPILIYWIGRLTLIANRGHLDDDPVTFALNDHATWAVGVIAISVLALST